MEYNGPVVGKDLPSFVDQLENVAIQVTDLNTAGRLETLGTGCSLFFHVPTIICSILYKRIRFYIHLYAEKMLEKNLKFFSMFYSDQDSKTSFVEHKATRTSANRTSVQTDRT